MDVQFAEQAAEGEMLLRRDVLVAEEDDEIFGERAVDFVHASGSIAGLPRSTPPISAPMIGVSFDADRFVGAEASAMWR